MGAQNLYAYMRDIMHINFKLPIPVLLLSMVIVSFRLVFLLSVVGWILYEVSIVNVAPTISVLGEIQSPHESPKLK